MAVCKSTVDGCSNTVFISGTCGNAHPCIAFYFINSHAMEKSCQSMCSVCVSVCCPWLVFIPCMREGSSCVSGSGVRRRHILKVTKDPKTAPVGIHCPVCVATWLHMFSYINATKRGNSACVTRLCARCSPKQKCVFI